MAAEKPNNLKKNMLAKRTISAILISMVVLVLAIAGGWIYTIGVALILTIASWEYTQMFFHGGYAPARISISASTLLCTIASYYTGFEPFMVVFSFCIFLVITYHIATYEKEHQTAGIDLAASLSALVFIAFLGSFLVRLRFLQDGLFWVITAVAPAGASDIAAYLIGNRFGRHKLAPKLSPGKTVEGYLAGIIAAALTGFASGSLAAAWHANIPPLYGLVIGAIVGVTCPLGDLGKSLIKRQFDLKDTGHLIPGHGGVLDRIDTWLWAGPFAYFLITLMFQ